MPNQDIAPTILQAPAVKNITQNQNASLTIENGAGRRIRQIVLMSQVTKTSPTAGAAFEPTLSDALGMISLLINDNSSKRDATAVEINEIQSVWNANLAATLISGKDINGNTVADTTETDNSVACTVRTSTWVLRYNFFEPSRDSYKSRRFFGLPTRWLDANGNVIATAKVALNIAVPGSATVANFVALTSMANGKYNLKGNAMRAEIVCDDVSGPFVGDVLQNGDWVKSSASTNKPAMPLVHWYRQDEGYTSTAPKIDKFPFKGWIQQQSFFSPSGSGDDITAFIVKKSRNGGAKVERFNTSKAANDVLKIDNQWNKGHLLTTSGDAAGTNWPAADVLHFGFDYEDDPTASEELADGDTLEWNLTLAQNTATNKDIIVISQVYRDALAS